MTGSELLADKAFTADLIPQKFPFVMVDALFSYSENTVETGLLITSDNIFVSDKSFREPGLIEHMAQSVALHTGYKFFLLKQDAPTGYIGSVSQLEISVLPKVGDSLRTSVEILQEFGGITMVSVATFCNDVEVAKGQMKTVLAS